MTIDSEVSDRLLEEAAAWLRASERLAVLTGAGISAESGIPTFRGAGGLWEGHRVEEVASPHAFAREPRLVWKFYHARRAALRQVQPNAGHLALVSLEDHWAAKRFTLITQNVDGLHRAAGSRNVLELHGNLARVRCTGCAERADRGHEELPDLPVCERCGQLLRPDVVWFHEALPQDFWQRAVEATVECSCLLVVGTSAVVYPAAGLIELARDAGARVIEVNLQQTDATSSSILSLFGPAGRVLPRLVELCKNQPGEAHRKEDSKTSQESRKPGTKA